MNEYSITHQPLSPIPPDNPNRNLKIARPDSDGTLPHVGLAGNTYTILLSGEDTNGRFCLIDMHLPPGGGPPPHRHDFEETFSLLEGEIEFTFRGEKVIVRAGETVNIPANAPHQLRNSSGKVARMHCLCAPAGQEEFFQAIGVRVSTRTEAPPVLGKEEQAGMGKKAESLAAKFRTEFIKPG